MVINVAIRSRGCFVKFFFLFFINDSTRCFLLDTLSEFLCRGIYSLYVPALLEGYIYVR